MGMMSLESSGVFVFIVVWNRQLGSSPGAPVPLPSRAQRLWTWKSLMSFQVSQTRGKQVLAPDPTSACLLGRDGNGESAPEGQLLGPLLSFLPHCWLLATYLPKHSHVRPLPSLSSVFTEFPLCTTSWWADVSTCSCGIFDPAEVMTKADLHHRSTIPSPLKLRNFRLGHITPPVHSKKVRK